MLYDERTFVEDIVNGLDGVGVLWNARCEQILDGVLFIKDLRSQASG